MGNPLNIHFPYSEDFIARNILGLTIKYMYKADIILNHRAGGSRYIS